jgi:hypothetical protein
MSAAPSVTVGPNTSYVLTAVDFQPPFYRINQILQQINGRIVTLTTQTSQEQAAQNALIAALPTIPTTFYEGPSTQANVTASRALATVYQNTGKTPLWVNAVVFGGGTGIVTMAASDSSATPTTEVAQTQDIFATSNTVYRTLSFIVLPGNYYKVTVSGSGSSGVGKWIEWA